MAELPILHMDATMRESLVQAYLPRAQFMTEVQAQMPHVTVLQVYDRAFSAHMLIPKDSIYGDTGSLKPEERAAKQARLEQDNQTRQNHAKRVLWWIRARARQFRGKGALVGLKRIDVLVICQQGLEDLLPSVGDLPAGVEIAHFNDVAGSDRWKGVACLIQIGRVSPMPSDIDTITGALHGWLPTPCPQPEKGIPWYMRVEQGIRLADGRGFPVIGDAHIDPVAEDVRWSICEGESLQGNGRPRGANRTEANPLQIDHLCNTVLPITINEVVAWADVAPTEFDEMLNRGVWLDNAADMAKAFPDLWVSDKAAEHAKGRIIEDHFEGGVPQTPLGEYPIKGNGGLLGKNDPLSADWIEVTYQLAGKGQKVRAVWFDLAVTPDPQKWLTDNIGPLSSFTTAQKDPAVSEAATVASAARSRIEIAFEIEGEDTMPLVKAYLATRPALKDLLGSEITAKRAIAEFLKAPLPAHVAIANFKAGTQKVASKALVRVGLSHEEAEASLSMQVGKPATLVDTPAAQPAAAAIPALIAIVDQAAVEDLAQPAKVVTMSSDLPGFEPYRSDRAEEPAPVMDNGGCSDVAPAAVVVLPVYLGRLRADGIWVGPGEEWMDDEFFPFRGAIQCRQRAYGPSGCPPHILAELMARQAATPLPASLPTPPPIDNRMRAILQQGMSEWGLY
jgi:hypothetical protein